MGKYVFSFFYFLIVTIYGYITLKDEKWMPWFLGGTAQDFSLMQQNQPFTPIGAGCITYGMLQLGYHGGDMIHLIFIEERQNDFLEMLMHHFSSVSLIGSMIFSNGMTVGCAIAFLHDIADITAALTKYYGQTPNDLCAAIWMIVNMVVWGYTRLMVLPYLIYVIFTTFEYRKDFIAYQPITLISGFFLCVMFCLHAYWYKIFCVMIYKAIKTGKSEDLQNKIQSTKKQN